MPMGVYQTYDNKWLIERFNKMSLAELCEKYNSAHGTNYRYEAIRWHCKEKLKLCKNGRVIYTEEQNEFLIKNYPVHGKVETARLFNEKFGECKSAEAIRTHCVRHLKLKVTNDRKKKAGQENRSKKADRTISVGDIVDRKGTLYRKVKSGSQKRSDDYKLLSDEVIGKPPKGQRIVYLDGDRLNCTAENMMFTRQKDMCLMSVYKLWSSNREVTKTGLMACELQNRIKEV